MNAALATHIPALATPVRPPMTHAEFELHVDEVFARSLEKRKNSTFERLKNTWNSNAKSRLILWAGLLAGSAVAAATGAAAVAGTFLFARAAVSAIGGYLTADSAFDLVAAKVGKNAMSKLFRAIETATDRRELDPLVAKVFESFEESRLSEELRSTERRASVFRAVKVVAAATSASVFAILGGSSAAEAAAAPASVSPAVEAAVSEVRGKALAALETIRTSAPFSVKEIFADIRADHPGQGYVTLEQSVRRVEGLVKGIPLSESEKLTDFNFSVSREVADPDGKIAQSMRKLSYLAEGQSVSDAAPRLTEEKIARILEDAYGFDSYKVPDSAALDSGAEAGKTAAAPLEPMKEVAKPANAVKNPMMKPEVVPVEAATQTVASATTTVPTGFPVGVGIATWGVFAALAAALTWNWSRRKRVAAAKNPTPPETAPAESNLPVSVPVPVHVALPPPPAANPPAAPEKPSRPADAPVRAEELPEWLVDLAGRDTATIGKIAAFRLSTEKFRDEFGFAHDVANCVRPENFEGTIAYALKSPSGTLFSASAKVDGSRAAICVKSSQDGKVFHDGSASVPLPASPEDIGRFAESVRAKIAELSVEAISKRNEAKLREFRDLEKFEIVSTDLDRILEQLEHPETLRTGHETGGHWFSSPILVKNGTLRFEGLASPAQKNILSGPHFFGVNDPTGEEYVLPNFSAANRRTFSEFEKIHMRTGGIFAPLYNFNWHKHPGGPLWPSSMDLNAERWAPQTFADAPYMPAITFAIANEFRDEGRLRNLVPGTFAVIRWDERGIPRNYVVTFWKLKRIEGQDFENRRSAVLRMGISAAARSGIVAADGRLLHLDRRVEFWGKTFWPDLVPVPTEVIPVPRIGVGAAFMTME